MKKKSRRLICKNCAALELKIKRFEKQVEKLEDMNNKLITAANKRLLGEQESIPGARPLDENELEPAVAIRYGE